MRQEVTLVQDELTEACREVVVAREVAKAMKDAVSVVKEATATAVDNA